MSAVINCGKFCNFAAFLQPQNPPSIETPEELEAHIALQESDQMIDPGVNLGKLGPLTKQGLEHSEMSRLITKQISNTQYSKQIYFPDTD